MEPPSTVLPVLAMMGLTAAVLLRMFGLRLGALRRGRLNLAYLRTGKGRPPPDAVVAAEQHFSNLFEVPVLFYVACVMALELSQADQTFVVLAWLFVASRAVHSAVHLTYNNPFHRFAAYAVGCVVLAVLVMRLAVAIV